MHDLANLIAGPVFVLAGVLLIVFHRRAAALLVRRQPAWYSVNTIFPMPMMLIIIGGIWIVAGAAILNSAFAMAPQG